MILFMLAKQMYLYYLRTCLRMQETEETRVLSLCSEDPLEEKMAIHSSTLAWKIPWMEKPHRLQSLGSQGVRKDWATSLSLFTCVHWRRKWQPLQCSCLENPRGGGAWWAAVYGVTQSRTRLSDFTLYGVREFSNFILLHIAGQFSQHHLLKRLSFLLCILLPPLSNIWCP